MVHQALHLARSVGFFTLHGYIQYHCLQHYIPFHPHTCRCTGGSELGRATNTGLLGDKNASLADLGLVGSSFDVARGLLGRSTDGERALTGSGWNGSSSASTTKPKPVLLGVEGKGASVMCDRPGAKTSRTLPVQTCAGLSDERRRRAVFVRSVPV